MKIWNSYGSEHSANLVLIGRFKDAIAAEEAKDAIEEAINFFQERDFDPYANAYSDEASALLRKLKVYSVSPSELSQFHGSFHIRQHGEKLVVTSDDELIPFLKFMIDYGAKVEMYSAHTYPDADMAEGE
jgi:Family of unknown function (DUF6375)